MLTPRGTLSAAVPPTAGITYQSPLPVRTRTENVVFVLFHNWFSNIEGLVGLLPKNGHVSLLIFMQTVAVPCPEVAGAGPPMVATAAGISTSLEL